MLALTKCGHTAQNQNAGDEMNEEAAHSDRLHHTGVTDVMDAKRSVLATRTLTGKVSDMRCLVGCSYRRT